MEYVPLIVASQYDEEEDAVRPCGAMVARLTPDQKVVCSNHAEVSALDV